MLGDAPYGLCLPNDESGGDSSFLLRFDASDGKERVLTKLPLTAQPLGAVDGQLLFAVASGPDEDTDSSDGTYETLLRVDASSGETRPLPLAGAPGGTPTLLDDAVYFVRDDGTVTAVSAADGTQLWRKVTEVENLSVPVWSKTYDSVLFANRFGRLLALDRATGTQRWRTAALDDPGDTGVDPQLLLVQDAIVAVVGSTAFSVRPDRPAAVD
ncbi:PQQ-binding-like beta-propeller repeat protein [Streptomyces sp. NPDC002588]|uniref:outer membrane protein assembly factor BamB family protein n=1 Tax=Streptomyces sp. NPDC002588 TaxID=3154419 RepID=UPI003325A441